MMIHILVLASLLVSVAAIAGKSEYETRGIVMLDGITYPKVFPSENYAGIVMFFNKGQIGAGELTDMYREDFIFMGDSGDRGDKRDLLMAQVIINGAQNKKLAEQVGITDNAKIPQVVMYKKGKDSKPVLFPYAEELSVGALRRFAKKFSGYDFPSPNQLAEYNDFADEFVAAKIAGEDTSSIIDKTKEYVKETHEGFVQTADYYIKCMLQIEERGFEWAEKEGFRIRDIKSSGRVTNTNKLALLEIKLDILSRFDKDEHMDPDREVPISILLDPSSTGGGIKTDEEL